jgi:hypothetical protein
MYMCIDLTLKLRVQYDLYQYKEIRLIPAAMDYYVINGKLLF